MLIVSPATPLGVSGGGVVQLARLLPRLRLRVYDSTSFEFT